MKLNNIIWIIMICILLYLVFNTIEYLSAEGYVVECFTNNIVSESSKTTHTVDLPLTNTVSCQNFCSPSSRCAISGQQCFTDIDCPGCQPSTPFTKKTAQGCVPGDNDAGKLTVGVTPQYSSLTSGYGTQKAIITDKLYGKPLESSFGVNNWRASFNASQDLFNNRYKPNQLQYMPNYPPMYSATGEFIGDGPLPSNY
jgi:hypothetical protein